MQRTLVCLLPGTMLILKGYEEMASLVAAFGITGPESCLGSTVELALVAGAWVSCLERVWAHLPPTVRWDRCSHLRQIEELSLGSRQWDSWPHPSLATALRRVGFVPHLGSIVELALVPWVRAREQ